MFFSIEPHDLDFPSREFIAVCSSSRNGTTWKVSKEPIDGSVPIGSVSYCEKLLKERQINVDFFPSFLSSHLNRDISNFSVHFSPYTLRERFFLKDKSGWKTDFVSRVYEVGEVIPIGEYIKSEIVKFENEWRYYILEGEVISTGWYMGEDEEEPAPDLDFKIPTWYNGSIDMGRVGKTLSVVESHAPYACGWYGDKHFDYVFWQYNAWRKYVDH